MGSKKNVTKTVTEDTVKVLAEAEPMTDQASNSEATTDSATGDVNSDQQSPTTSDTTAPQASAQPKPKNRTGRSRRYQAVRAQVDKTKKYDAFAAIELAKKLSYSTFAGTISADAVVKEEGTQVSLTFPHSTGRTIRAAIVNDQILAALAEGTIDFDVLITEPRFMPQLAQYAKMLGPKGLMPNPKNGTVTSNPELKKKELEGGKTTLKTERKAPLMHVTIGRTDMSTEQLVANLQALTQALKGKLVKLSISATMSPGVRVNIE